MERRNFLQIIGGIGTIAVFPSLIPTRLFAENGQMFVGYGKVKLVDALGKPLLAGKLKKETAYIFNYPFVGTPSMLIDLGTATQKDVTLKSEAGDEYVWKGGIGKESSIVAYSAICAHQLTHPNPKESFIKYFKKGEKTVSCSQDKVIVCSSHMSSYDPAHGCKNLGGDAREPLASIVLEHDTKTDELYAVAVVGVGKFVDYFDAFGDEMEQYYKGKREAKAEVSVQTKTVELKKYSKEVIGY